VQVDAVVTDSKGHQITDLKPEDFQVFEDGKLQTLTHFSYVQVAPERQPAPELKAAVPKPSPNSVSALPPGPLAQIRPEDVRRTIVLMVDDLGLSFESMAFVRSSLRKFVNQQLQPETWWRFAGPARDRALCSSSPSTSVCCCRSSTACATTSTDVLA